MLRPLAAGLMCLGFVTLGVTVSGGQHAETTPKTRKKDLIVIEEKNSTDLISAEDAIGEKEIPAAAKSADAPSKENRIEIRIGEDGAATIVGDGDKKNVKVRSIGAGTVILNQEPGKTAEKGNALDRIHLRLNSIQAPAETTALDPATRAAVEILIAGLKDEVKRLQDEKRKEEAVKKLQSIRAAGTASQSCQ